MSARRQKSLDEYYVWEEAERVKTRELTYEMDHEAVRQQMAVETHQRDHIDGMKKKIHDKETEVLQGDLDKLEEQNRKLSQRAREMAYSTDRLSHEEIRKKYHKVKKQSIFDDDDCTTVPVRKPV